MNFTISQDKRDKMVVFGEYADGNAYVELPIIDGVRVYTGVCLHVYVCVAVTTNEQTSRT